MKKNLVGIICVGTLFAQTLAFTPVFASEEATTEAISEEMVGIPNPVKEMDSAADFEALGITMDAPDAAENVSYSTIANEVAQITFDLADASYTLRCSSEFSGTTLSGIMETSIDPDKESEEIYSAPNGSDVTVTGNISRDEAYKIKTWNMDDLNYSLVIEGDVSAMLFGEVFDGILNTIPASEMLEEDMEATTEEADFSAALDAFADLDLGLSIPRLVVEEPECSVEDDVVAKMSYDVSGLSCTLEATSDEAAAEKLTTMDTGMMMSSNSYTLDDDSTLDVAIYTSKTGTTSVDTWTNDGKTYTFTMEGESSVMLRTEIFEDALMSTGVTIK